MSVIRQAAMNPVVAALGFLTLLATLGATQAGPPVGEVAGSMGSGLVSPSVVATWIVRKAPGSESELQLLVLWRGTTGWSMKGESSASSSQMSTRADGKDRGVVVTHIDEGGIGLDLEFDGNQRVARVQDKEIPLGSHNVILVDAVDDPEGLRVVDSLEVDGRVPDDEASAAEVIIRRNPELYAYLRCGDKLPDADTQSMIDVVCARMQPK